MGGEIESDECFLKVDTREILKWVTYALEHDDKKKYKTAMQQILWHYHIEIPNYVKMYGGDQYLPAPDTDSE